MKHTLLSALALFCLLTVRAQTLVNTSIIDTVGHVVISQNLQTAFADFDNLQAIGVFNQYATGLPETFSVMKVDFSTGLTDWSIAFDTLSAYSDFANAVKIKGDYAYLAAFSWDSANAYAEFATLKLRMTDGSVVWKRTYNGAFNGYDIPADIVIDNAENIYVVGTEQTDSLDYAFTAIKYDSSGTQQWVSHYDSLGYYDGAVAASFGPTGGVLAVTGFSGSGYTNWDFQTMYFSFTDGHTVAQNRSANASGALSRPVDIEKDFSGNFYLLGTSAVSMGNTDFKLIKYDAAFNEVWVRTWGDSLLPDTAASLLVDFFSGDCYVTGIRNKLGGTDAALLRYSTDGDLLWARQIQGAGPVNVATGAELYMNDDADQVYLTGKIFNGTDNDILAARFDTAGNMVWQNNFGRTVGSDDEGVDMFLENGNLIVSAISKATDTLYLGVKFEQHDFSTTFVTDTDTVAIYTNKELIIRFDTAALIMNAIDKDGLMYGKPQVFLQPWAVDTVDNYLPDISFQKGYLRKLAAQQHIRDTIRISATGDTVIIPPFWSSFVFTRYAGDSSETYYADTFSAIKNVVKWAEPNYVIHPLCDCSTACPTDPYYDGTAQDPNGHYHFQYGLHENTVDAGHEEDDINIEPAWELETGKPFVKVGIFDTGIEYRHEDFQNDATSVVSGKIYTTQPYVDITTVDGLNGTIEPDQFGHGTLVAGIIGAVRNNDIGIAGIAGGNYCPNPTKQPGVRLQAFKADIANATSGNGGIHAEYTVENLSKALTDLILNCPDVQITNHSYGSIYPSLELKQKHYTAWRLGKTAAAGRGNLSLFRPHTAVYPACYNDEWIMNVTGSTTYGQFDNLNSLSENEVDVMAPYSTDLNYSTFSLPLNSYGTASGTSMSTAFVTGLGALLLSYLNNPTDLHAPENLAPEDVEQLIERSAYNENFYPSAGYTFDQGGWGRIDAGKTFNQADKTKSRLLHYSNETSPILSQQLTKISGSTDIQITIPESNYNVDAGDYLAEVWQFDAEISHNLTLQPGEVIEGYWPRSSGCKSFPLYTTDAHGVNFLDPYEHFEIVSLDENTATLRGYYYNLKKLDSSPVRWLPKTPTAGGSNTLPYTIHTFNPTITAIKEPINSNDVQISLFPNPANVSFNLSIHLNKEEDISIEIFNNLGQRMATVFSGKVSDYSKNISTQAFSSGIYNVQVKSPGLNKTLKLVVQK